MTRFEKEIMTRYSDHPLAMARQLYERDNEIYERDHEIKRLKADLIHLTVCVRRAHEALDRVMNGPPTVERGRKIAKITNYLEDCNSMFGFKKPVKKSAKSKT